MLKRAQQVLGDQHGAHGLLMRIRNLKAQISNTLNVRMLHIPIILSDFCVVEIGP